MGEWGRRLREAYRCEPGGGAWEGLEGWYRDPLGRALLEAERELLDPVLADLFGYHLLQVGRPHQADLLGTSRIRHRLLLDTRSGLEQEGSRRLLARAEALPVASDSIDLLLYPHSLEFSDDPHQALREAERVLIPEGHIVILGFNPTGWFGLNRLLSGWRGRAPWCGRFIGSSRLRDWLSLLGFDTVTLRGAFYRPPLPHPGALQRTAPLEGLRSGGVFGAGVYLLVAKKRVTTLTPIRPRWRPRRGLLGTGLTEPSARRDKS